MRDETRWAAEEPDERADLEPVEDPVERVAQSRSPHDSTQQREAIDATVIRSHQTPHAPAEWGSEPQAWGHPVEPAGRRMWPIVAAAVVVAAFSAATAGFGYTQHWFGVGEPDPSPAVAAPAASPTPTASPGDAPEDTSPSPSPSESSADEPTATPTVPTPAQKKQEALATLDRIVQDDRTLDPIRGQWVAQLASKFEGVHDEAQQSEPFTVPQILAEVRALRADGGFGAPVRTVLQGDWGDSTPGDKPLWVTFADIDETSRDGVEDWCAEHFSERGEALERVCYARQMTRP